MAIDPTPSPLHRPPLLADHPSSPQGRPFALKAPTAPVNFGEFKHELEDWAFFVVSIASTLAFDEWSAVVVARVVDEGLFVEAEQSEYLAEVVHRALYEASREIDVSDHRQFSEFLNRGGRWEIKPFEDEDLPDYAWALINRLRDMSDFQRLALVRQIQAALGLTLEDDLSLVEALKQEGLIRL